MDGNVVNMTEKNTLITFWFENLQENDYMGDLGTHRRIISRESFKFSVKVRKEWKLAHYRI